MDGEFCLFFKSAILYNIIMELIDVKGVGAKTLEKLKKLGIESVKDAIYFYPKFYCSFRLFSGSEITILINLQ